MNLCTTRKNIQQLLGRYGGEICEALERRGVSPEAPVSLFAIAEMTEPLEAVWALRAVPRAHTVARFLAAEIAGSVLPLYEALRPQDLRPRRAVEAGRMRGEYGENAIALDEAGLALLKVAEQAYQEAWEAALSSTSEVEYGVAQSAMAAATGTAWGSMYHALRALWYERWKAAQSAGHSDPDALANQGYDAASQAMLTLLRRYQAA